MKRLAAILLLGILLFNWVGYRLVNALLEDGASRSLEARLDRQQYDQSQLISMKVPVTRLSYYNSSTAFQRTYGQIEIKGVPYRFVASRIFNDSIEMLCIPNTTVLQLRHLGRDYFKMVNDIGQNAKPDGHTHQTRDFTGDPFTCIQTIGVDHPFYTLKKSGYHFLTHLSSLKLPTDEQPPNAASV